MFHTTTISIKVDAKATRSISCISGPKADQYYNAKGRVYAIYTLQCKLDGGMGFYYERLSIQVYRTAHRFYVEVAYRPTVCTATTIRGMGVAPKSCFAEQDFSSMVLLGLRQIFPDIDQLHASLPTDAKVPDVIQRLADVGAFEGYHSAVLTTVIDY